MEKRTASLLLIILVGIIGISLVGCAGAPTATVPARPCRNCSRRRFSRRFLRTRPRDGPSAILPAGTLMIHKRPGAVCYAFPDQASKTIYLGDEAAYWRLQGLLEKQEQKINEQRRESDPEFWNAWGHRYGGG